MLIDVYRAVSTRQVLVLSVRNVEVRLGVTELLSQAEVNHINLVASFPDTHQEVVRLDVTVNEVARVNVLDAGDLQY